MSSQCEIFAHLARFTYFEDYSLDLLKEVCKIAKKKKYNAHDVILSDKSGFKSYVHFVITGLCEMIEVIRGPKKRHRFVKVCVFDKLSCFNLGENLDLSKRVIVAVIETECILIPYYWLLENNVGNIWKRVQQYLNWMIPKTDDIIRELFQAKMWRKYRKKLMLRIQTRLRKVAPLNQTDIPRCCFL